MRFTSFLASCAACAALTLSTAHSLSAQSYQVDPVHSGALFTIQHLGLGNTYGRFNTLSGSINFEAEDLSTASFVVSIPVASIDTNAAERDEHLRSADFFDVEQFPTMNFTSSSVVAFTNKPDCYAIVGTLSIHGVSKVITVEAKVLGQGMHPMTKTPAISFETTFTIERSDFDIAQGDLSKLIGNTVQITVGLEAIVPPVKGEEAAQASDAEQATPAEEAADAQAQIDVEKEMPVEEAEQK